MRVHETQRHHVTHRSEHDIHIEQEEVEKLPRFPEIHQLAEIVLIQAHESEHM